MNVFVLNFEELMGKFSIVLAPVYAVDEGPLLPHPHLHLILSDFLMFQSGIYVMIPHRGFILHSYFQEG